MTLKSLVKSLRFGVPLVAALALSGCGLDDIQLNGKLFDAVGMNNTGSVKKEAKVAERQPLVVPPGLEALPEPGSAGAAQAAGIPDIQDHDAKRQVSQADLERKQAEYCEIHYHRAKAHGDQNYDLAEGPMGSCRGSVMNAIKKINGTSAE